MDLVDMDEDKLFKALKRQTKATLLELIYFAYHEMNTQQRRTIFGELMEKEKPSKPISKNVISASKKFHKDSLAGKYYAPFAINSKNFSHIPEETEQWFEELGDLLKKSLALTKSGDHQSAVQAFDTLYDLIDTMECGEEIIFADEYGSWMIPGNEKDYLDGYILSLSNTNTPEEYAKSVIPLLKRDSFRSFCNRVYSITLKHGNQEQNKYLKDEIKTQKIRVKSSR